MNLSDNRVFELLFFVSGSRRKTLVLNPGVVESMFTVVVHAERFQDSSGVCRCSCVSFGVVVCSRCHIRDVC